MKESKLKKYIMKTMDKYPEEVEKAYKIGFKKNKLHKSFFIT